MAESHAIVKDSQLPMPAAPRRRMKERCRGTTLTGLPCLRDAKYHPERARFAYCHDHHHMWARFEPASSAPAPETSRLPVAGVEADASNISSMYAALCDVPSLEASSETIEDSLTPCTPRKRTCHAILEASVAKEGRSVRVCRREKQPEELLEQMVPLEDAKGQLQNAPGQVSDILNLSRELTPAVLTGQAPLICYSRRSLARTGRV
mmetsp:Transcript_119785/g.207941  ORF Transcript_119785/g.207941 Transcript_119785/m.207941 type:complete len:207 (-) Transcript_119785:59-679(-)